MEGKETGKHDELLYVMGSLQPWLGGRQQPIHHECAAAKGKIVSHNRSTPALALLVSCRKCPHFRELGWLRQGMGP